MQRIGEDANGDAISGNAISQEQAHFALYLSAFSPLP
jgi:hypothetical protein